MEGQKALYSIPSIRNHVTSQGNRTGRFNDSEPISLVLHIYQEIEDTHHKERNGIAYEKPGRCGLNLRDNPMRMRSKEEYQHQHAQTYHRTHKLERLLLVSPMNKQNRSKGSRHTQSMMHHIARKERQIQGTMTQYRQGKEQHPCTRHPYEANTSD